MANLFLKSNVFNSFTPVMSLNNFEIYSTSFTNKYTSAKEIWNSMYAHFEGTKEEIDESCSNKELVEIHDEEVSTSRRKEEKSIHEEHEENHLCLMGHNEEVSNSNSDTNDHSYEELQDVFNELYVEFEKMILKNNDLKKQISLLSKHDLNESISSKNICEKCDDLKEENDFLKDRVERLELENGIFFFSSTCRNFLFMSFHNLHV